MKLAFPLLLLLGATQVWAEWTYVGRSDNWDAYVDLTTTRTKGKIVKMWSLLDYATAQHGAREGKFLSSKVQDEYDCEEGQSRTLYFSWHTGSMGAGQINYEGKEPHTGWAPVPPGSWAETFWKIACKQ